jgi:hypothetical protein
MTNLIINGIAFVIIPFGIFSIFGWLIYYHLKRYGIEGDSTKKTAYLFTVVLIMISISIVIAFFSIDWDKSNMQDFFEKSKIISYPQSYEQ